MSYYDDDDRKIVMKTIFSLLFGVIVLFIIVHSCLRASGYHLQWSKANMRWIYVDESGKP